MTTKRPNTRSNTRVTYSHATRTIRAEDRETDTDMDTDTDAVPAAVPDPGEPEDEEDDEDEEDEDEDEDEETKAEPVPLFSSIRPANIKPTSSRKADGRQNVRPYRKVYLMKTLGLNGEQWTELSNALTAVYENNLALLEIQCSKNASIFCDRLNEIGLPNKILKALPKMPFMLYQAALVIKAAFNASSGKLQLVWMVENGFVIIANSIA